MITTIQPKLKQLEAAMQIQILNAVESGSRAWGFASPNSDWDVRFIYIQFLDWYLQVNDKKDSIERMLPNNLDLSGWELQKVLPLLRKSNPPLLEWLRSPLVYQKDDAFVTTIEAAANRCFNPKNCLYHYYHMAKGNWDTYFKGAEVRLKKYLYVLRPILACNWIEQTNTMIPMEFDTLFQRENLDPVLHGAIKELLDRKKSGDELSMGPRIALLDGFLEERLQYFDTLLKNYPTNDVWGREELKQVFKTTLFRKGKLPTTTFNSLTLHTKQKQNQNGRQSIHQKPLWYYWQFSCIESCH